MAGDNLIYSRLSIVSSARGGSARKGGGQEAENNLDSSWAKIP